MTPEKAQALLRQEMATNSVVAQALTVLLEDTELRHYRRSQEVADPFSLAMIAGRGQGVQSIIKRISPIASDAPAAGPTL